MRSKIEVMRCHNVFGSSSKSVAKRSNDKQIWKLCRGLVLFGCDAVLRLEGLGKV